MEIAIGIIGFVVGSVAFAWIASLYSIKNILEEQNRMLLNILAELRKEKDETVNK